MLLRLKVLGQPEAEVEMITWLISLGLVCVPFITIYGQDIRELKFQLAAAIALALSLFVGYTQGIIFNKNKYAVIFVFYLWLATMLAPAPGVSLIGMNLGYFWAWKPLYFILIYFLFISAISCYQFKGKEIKILLNVVLYSGVVMSALVFIQACMLDQFFIKNELAIPHPQWYIGGTLGQPIFVGCFLAIIPPIALYLKKYKEFFIIFIAVLVTQSVTAIGAMACSLLIYWSMYGVVQFAKASCVLLVLIFLALGMHISTNVNMRNFISSSGRIAEWKQIIVDINSPISKEEECKFPITGRGMGSFHYVYHWDHKNRMYEAHNEYIELAYNAGIVGLALFVLAIFQVFNINQYRMSPYRKALSASFIAVILSSGAMFVLQLGAIIFYTCVIVGLLQNSCEGE